MNILMLRTFMHVAEARSFSEAALRLGVSRGQCSKQIANLEAELGAVLLSRSTRRVSLTIAGQEYLKSVKAVLELLDEANGKVASLAAGTEENIRIAAPTSFANCILGPVINRMISADPKLTLQIVSLEEPSSSFRAGPDCAIAFGEAGMPDMVVWHEDSIALDLVASPAYLGSHGAPRHPKALDKHRCMQEDGLAPAAGWPFRGIDDAAFFQKVHPVLSGPDGSFVRSMAIGGAGIALLPRYLIAEDVAQGRLVTILRRQRICDRKIYLLATADALNRPRTLKFLETLREALEVN